jgi:hypothetical protein
VIGEEGELVFAVLDIGVESLPEKADIVPLLGRAIGQRQTGLQPGGLFGQARYLLRP